jgi:superfamily I DNA/RNA helicase
MALMTKSASSVSVRASYKYKWIKLLFNGNNKVFCVGDDDQSIYGWRGAKIENILKLEFRAISALEAFKILPVER